MIVATAGHVDHGKTLLVRTLTGVDTDRLPEEKERGMTIDLGFAYWRAEDDLTIGFVDVPGHEKFVRNMLSGVAGIDFVLLTVAADDGVMRQTREHVAILDLVGVARGAVAITKIDRVPHGRVDTVRKEVRELLAQTGLAAAPILPVSAVTGEGIDALKLHLVDEARRLPARVVQGNFRLAIDRAFTIAGAGLVVTGAALSGSIAVGDSVRVLCASTSARLRSLHAQNRAAKAGRAGDRCALNLTGADLTLQSLQRGDWIVAPDAPAPAQKLDARVRVLASEARALAHWTPVHVHLGAADVTGRVALLEKNAVAPGSTGLAQLVLDRPLGAAHNDKFILRDQSAQRTIGGGVVIDIFPPRRGRARPERLAWLQAMELSDHAAALAQLLERAPGGLDLGQFARNRNLSPPEANALMAAASLQIVSLKETRIAFPQRQWQRLKALALEQLTLWHRRNPNAIGPSDDRIFVGGPIQVAREVAISVAVELVKEGKVIRDSGGVHLPQHRPKLAATDAAVWKRIEPLLDEQPLRPPSLHELATSLHENPKKLESMLVRAARLGLLVRLTPNRFYRPAALRQLGEIAASLAMLAPDRRITAAALRDRLGVGRNVAVDLLEYFDRIKFMRRVGDAHEVIGKVEMLVLQ